MRDVLCPNCQKDEYRIVRVNGVKVKQCRSCGVYYQLAEEEIVTERVEKYLPDCKDAKGNFVKCPKCGRTDIQQVSEMSLYEFIMFGFQLYVSKRGLSHDSEEYYLCRNPFCKYIWWKGLDC